MGVGAASQPFSLHASIVCSQPQPDLGMYKIYEKKQIQNWEPKNSVSSLNFPCEASFGLRLSKQWASSLTMRNACSKDYFRSGRLKVIAVFHGDISSSSAAQESYSRVQLATELLLHFKSQIAYPCDVCFCQAAVVIVHFLKFQIVNGNEVNCIGTLSICRLCVCVLCVC